MGHWGRSAWIAWAMRSTAVGVSATGVSSSCAECEAPACGVRLSGFAGAVDAGGFGSGATDGAGDDAGFHLAVAEGDELGGYDGSGGAVFGS
jgi:hypothetical protein